MNMPQTSYVLFTGLQSQPGAPRPQIIPRNRYISHTERTMALQKTGCGQPRVQEQQAEEEPKQSRISLIFRQRIEAGCI